MQAIRIIPCLDIKDGRIVKGTNFVHLRDVGDPVEAARAYEAAGASELVILDISATIEGRETMQDVTHKIASAIRIPLTVGGGIRSTKDISRLFAAGAKRVSLNSVAVQNPLILDEAVRLFGSDRIILAIDALWNPASDQYDVYTHGGQVNTGLDAVSWAVDAAKRGVGALLPTSKDRDGTKAGYDNRLNKLLSSAVDIPVIASGGAGKLRDFSDAVTEGGVAAVLAASLFHFGEVRIPELRQFLEEQGIPTV